MPVGYFFAVAAAMFAVGLVGLLTRRNAIVLFMCVELMLNSVNLTFVTAALRWGEPDGQILAFFTIVVAAAEVVVGLALIVNIFWRRGSLDVDVPSLLRG